MKAVDKSRSGVAQAG